MPLQKLIYIRWTENIKKKELQIQKSKEKWNNFYSFLPSKLFFVLIQIHFLISQVFHLLEILNCYLYEFLKYDLERCKIEELYNENFIFIKRKFFLRCSFTVDIEI